MAYKDQSGIYAFVYHNEVIYVGQSVNIQRRLIKHHGIDCNIRQGKNIRLYSFLKKHLDEIQFLVLPVNKNKLNQKEKYYITKYKPKFNYKGVVVPY